MELGAASAGRIPPGRRHAPRRPRDAGAATRLRRIALVAAVLALVPALFSYVGALTERSNAPFGIRTVEWLRNNGAASLVAKVESIYYTLTAPSKGGPALKALPRVGYGTSTGSVAEYRPARVHAIVHPALPGEGIWSATRTTLQSEPPVLVTTLRDQPEYPRVFAGLAWINTKKASITLNPGRLEPAVTLPRGETEVPRSARPKLLATFNSGFKLADSHGGFAVRGHTYAPMVNGEAAFVGYTNGTYDVVEWHSGSTVPANVSFARQNLPLIVSGGRPTANIANTSEWGATVGNAVLVWRSAIGVDARGNLIYAAGGDQSVSSIANALVRAGAVRGMELDLNSFWVSFISYGAPGAEEPKNLLPGMERSPQRYLEPDDRDFFAIYSH